MSRKAYYYAVRKGQNIGIYHSWNDCQRQVSGYSNAEFKKFSSAAEAQDYLNKSSIDKTASNRNSSTHSLPFTSTNRLLTSNSGVSKVTKPINHGVATNHGPLLNRELISDELCFNHEIVYTDGATRGNGKFGAKGGYGVFFKENDLKNISKPLTGVQTNQRAELSAVRDALIIIEKDLASGSKKHYTIRTDSRYTINSITKWVTKWKQNDWRTATGPVQNRDLIEPCTNLMESVNSKYKELGMPPLNIEYVKGHSGDYGNEMADKLATAGADRA
ncbi:hypothetical protein LJB42_000088 [Komagataella kurtzmanii]|nr:hypothetical protein LJB42_000088 [Komagataella kurtzmanii]